MYAVVSGSGRWINLGPGGLPHDGRWAAVEFVPIMLMEERGTARPEGRN